jgi:hypothetical protein
MLPDPPDFLAELRTKTLFRHPDVLGCIRRNRLDPSTPWRWARGNSLLLLIGETAPLQTPFGGFDVFYRGTEDGLWLLQFRGGQRQPWWDEDALLLAALVLTYSSLNPVGVSTISELDGQLYIHYLGSPDAEEAFHLAEAAMERWKRGERIAKDSPRGKAICPYCPVRNPCLLLDLEAGETHDWPLQPDLRLRQTLLERHK